IAEPRSKALNLRLNARQHVHRAFARDVAIPPRRMPAFRRATPIESARLDQQHERLVRYAAVPGLELAPRDFLERAAQVHSTCARALRGAPRDRAIQRPVHFECGHAISVTLEGGAVRRGQSMTGYAQERPR